MSGCDCRSVVRRRSVRLTVLEAGSPWQAVAARVSYSGRAPVEKWMQTLFADSGVR